MSDFTLTDDATPAMCDVCGSVRRYDGKQPYSAFLRCDVCSKRTGHHVISAVNDEAHDKELQRSRRQIWQQLHIAGALSACGFTFDESPHAWQTWWAPGYVAAGRTTPGNELVIFFHPDYHVKTLSKQLLRILTEYAENGFKPGKGIEWRKNAIESVGQLYV